MKTNSFGAACARLLAKAACAALLSTTVVPRASAIDSPERRHKPSKNATRFEAQLQRYLQPGNFPLPNFKRGIVMLSFYLSDAGDLYRVVSYSQNAELDRYLLSCLEGKAVDARHLAKGQQHYLKIRFNLNQ